MNGCLIPSPSITKLILELLILIRNKKMKVSYYDLAKQPEDSFARRHGRWKKKKLLTFAFYNKFLEVIRFENSDRGHLFWWVTPETVRVFGFWTDSDKFYRTWHNDHCGYC